jgi:hypothetical protein
MTDTTTRGAGPAARAQHAGGDGPAPERRRRMSVGRKQGAVLRLLRGEALEGVAGGLKLRHDPMRGCGAPAPHNGQPVRP